MTTPADQILALKTRVEQAAKLRNDAEVARGVAVAQLTGVDAELKALGVDPDNSEQELAALDAQIATLTAQVETQVTAETAAYTEILDKARQAGIR